MSNLLRSVALALRLFVLYVMLILFVFSLLAGVLLAGDHINNRYAGVKPYSIEYHTKYPVDKAAQPLMAYLGEDPSRDCRYIAQYGKDLAAGSTDKVSVSMGTNTIGGKKGVWFIAKPAFGIVITATLMEPEEADDQSDIFFENDGSVVISAPKSLQWVIFCGVRVGDPGDDYSGLGG